MKRFALAGNPNSGKTTLFNMLTGSTEYVGNWPGVTVEKKVGTYKKLEEPIEIVDLPGIYSLSPYTPEEVIARKYIIEEKPDAVINIIDATNLERNLYLTTQLLEMDVPLIVVLNMYDVVEKNGDLIDSEALSKALGVSVVNASATKGTGIKELMEKAYFELKTRRTPKTIIKALNINSLLDKLEKEYENKGISNPLFHAIKLAEYDELEIAQNSDLLELVDSFKKDLNDSVFGDDIEAIIADDRYKFIQGKCSIAYHHRASLEDESEGKTKEKLSNSDKIDRVLTNKWAGIPIFLVILFLIFHLTFSENLFWFGGLFTDVTPSFEGTMFEGLLWTDGGINSPGVILFNLLGSLTGALSDLFASWLQNAPAWISGLIVDGICAGIFSVLSFVPQILFLFLFFSILEDSGYMARVAFILDSIFRKFGLSGRAFMPMIMGFGCSVPAMINARTLATENEKTATIRVIPFFSCGAKQPILIAISAGICAVFDFPHKDLIVYLMYLFGVITAIVTIILMRNTTMRGKVPPFIMELPSYHMPKFKSLSIHMWDKLKHYVKKAFTIILASTIVIWFMQSFTWSFHFIDQANPMEITEEVFEGNFDDSIHNEDELNASKSELLSLYSDAFDDEGNLIVDFETLYNLYLEMKENDINETKLLAYENYCNNVLVSANEEYKSIVNEENYIDSSKSILASVGRVLTPIFTPLGFGLQLNRDNGWIFPVSALTGLIAKENVIATFAVLAQCTTTKATTFEDFKEIYEVNLTADSGDAAAVQMIKNTNATWPGLIAFIVFNMTTIPCFAAIATAKAELVTSKDDKLGKKRFRNTLLFWILTSYIASTLIYLSFEFIWPIAIFLVLISLTVFLIYRYNKTHPIGE